jgi:radical SAM protein with 4Fe4S-binding SPASM domain
MCFYNKRNNKKELSAENFIDFFKTIKNLNLIQFPGREPFAKKDFSEIVSYFKDRKIPSLFLTNGTLITEKNVHNLTYDKNNIVMISLDGDRNLHDSIRGVDGVFDKTINAINLINNNCVLKIVCVITDKNLYDLWKLPSIIKDLGLSEIIFEYERIYTHRLIEESGQILGGGEGFSDLCLKSDIMPKFSELALKREITKACKMAKKQKVKISFLPDYFIKENHLVFNREIRRKYVCTCRYLDKIRIDPEGNYIHCFAYRKSFGNILTDSLEDVWNSEEYRTFRKKLLHSNLLPICETCWAMTPVSRI